MENIDRADRAASGQERSGHPVHTCRSAALDFLAENPKGVYTIIEIAAEIGWANIGTVRKELSRLKEEGKVERTQRGFYRYLSSIKLGIVDQIIDGGKVGIENLVFIRRLARKGDTPSQCGMPQGFDCGTNRDSTLAMEVEVNRADRATTGQQPGKEPIAKKGYPWILPTGQEVQWWIYENGTEAIIIKSGGKLPLSLDTILLLNDQLMQEGLGPDWEKVSLEWNIDNKRFFIAEPVTFQTCQEELLKLYQHGGLARLEGVNRQVIGFPDTLLALIQVYERAEGHHAMKEVEKMQKRVKQIEKDCRMNNNLIHSLSDRLHRDEPRKEKPLTT